MTQNHHLLASGIAFAILTLAGCGDGTPPADAAPADAGPTMDAAPGEPCTRDSECDDGLFCTVRRCVPADPSADSRGCLTVGSPCAEGEMCSEADELCSAIDCSTPDQDGDGEDAVACGGVDCDDSDKFRFGGRTEICDAEGHDEDCVDDTLAGPDDGDLDGDGFVSDACCFGTTCGGDCDDDDGAVNPDAREVCNGLDDDCSGGVDDETAGPLCPGGSCLSGRCSFTPWDRIVGNLGNDFLRAVTTDDAGNVYAVGSLYGGADFGAGPEPPRLMVSYSPDGVLRWTLPFPEEQGHLDAYGIAYDPARDRVIAVGNFRGEALTLAGTTLAGAPGFGVLFAVRSDGTPAWIRELPELVGNPSGTGAGVAVWSEEIVALGAFDRPFRFGTSERTPAGDVDGFIAWYSADGAPLRDREFGAAGASVRPQDLAVDEAGNAYLLATFAGSVDFGDGLLTSDAEDSVVLAFDPLRGLRWTQLLASPGFTTAVSIAANINSVFVAGRAALPFAFAGSGPSLPENGFALGMSPVDGSHVFTRSFQGLPASGDGYSVPRDVAVTQAGDLVCVGGFYGTVAFGTGGLTSTMDMFGPGDDIFVTRFGPTGVHIRDRALGEEDPQHALGLDLGPGGALTIVGRFGNSINLGSGVRTTGRPGVFGFVGRVVD